ncbi:glycosyltransferase family 4 protein [Propioniferax innocua]|uniref:Uncharacterized protein n=1 Tax=Propioniferax innocua TaxID=1753 RepID=A0A542ZDE7_9ACTN|nr:glycosyltransferase family 4 protein [Propioniferax innocua]TQL58299.1 hypothetical protein FB460_2159 [Propioniferax innocua]
MKVTLFDGIQEMHVVHSLASALRARGHDVQVTGKLTGGFTYIESTEDQLTVSLAITSVAEFEPDLILVFRPAALPPQLIQLLRGRIPNDCLVLAWFSDDPVLWKLSYAPTLDFYDFVLHCGSERILKFYESNHGRPTGLNFPFWTGQDQFARVYGSKEPETDAVFLGNVGNSVRRERYFLLSSLGVNLRVHGDVPDDHFHLSGGLLDSHRELEEMAATSRIAINIPQRFSDHANRPTWFEGLDALGTFELPSRVIQCAAMGLPVVSLETIPPSHRHPFPEVTRVPDPDALQRTIKAILNDTDLRALSEAVHSRFRSTFSASARALMLEHLAQDPETWRQLSAEERTTFYEQFDGDSAINTSAETVKAADRSTMRISPDTQRRLRIVIAGERWREPFSLARITERSLRALGHTVTRLDLASNETRLKTDHLGELRGELTWSLVDEAAGDRADVLFLCSNEYLPPPPSARPCVWHGAMLNNVVTPATRIAARCHRITSPQLDQVAHWITRGFTNLSYLPDLFDAEMLAATDGRAEGEHAICVLSETERHVRSFPKLWDWAPETDILHYTTDRISEFPAAMERLAAALGGMITCTLPDPSRAGNLPHRLLGVSLAARNIVLIPRTCVIPADLQSGVNCLVFNDPREAQLKLRRLARDNPDLEPFRDAARAAALDRYSAEKHMGELLASLQP